MLQKVVMNRVGDVEPNHIHVFEWPQHRQTDAKPIFYHVINGLGIRNSIFNDGKRFAPESVLKAVAHKAGHIFIDNLGPFSAT